MEKKPSYLVVYKKFLNYFWVEVNHYVFINGDDIMGIFRNYRDVYKNKYGSKRLKIVVKWNDEVYDKW